MSDSADLDSFPIYPLMWYFIIVLLLTSALVINKFALSKSL